MYVSKSKAVITRFKFSSVQFITIHLVEEKKRTEQNFKSNLARRTNPIVIFISGLVNSDKLIKKAKNLRTPLPIIRTYAHSFVHLHNICTSKYLYDYDNNKSR